MITTAHEVNISRDGTKATYLESFVRGPEERGIYPAVTETANYNPGDIEISSHRRAVVAIVQSPFDTSQGHRHSSQNSPRDSAHDSDPSNRANWLRTMEFTSLRSPPREPLLVSFRNRKAA